MKMVLRRFSSHLAAAALLALLAVPSAFAHSRPKVMEPAADSTVASPSKISVTFSGEFEPNFSSITLTDEKGEPVIKEKSKADASTPKTLILDVPASLPAGGYLVHWVTVGADGHRMEGEYKFTVK